jgi:hypothetical protein
MQCECHTTQSYASLIEVASVCSQSQNSSVNEKLFDPMSMHPGNSVAYVGRLRAHFGWMNMAAARHNDTAKLHLCDMAEPSLLLLDGVAAVAGVKEATTPCHQFSFQQREGKVAGVSNQLVTRSMRAVSGPLTGCGLAVDVPMGCPSLSFDSRLNCHSP